MLLRKTGVTNYFIVMLILMGLTAVLVVSTFILTAVFPDSLGRNPYKYDISTVCEFEPWSFEVDSLKVDFPQGGIIAAINVSDRKRSVMLLGEGSFEQEGLALDSLDTGGLFMVLEHTLFEEIRGSNIFMPIEDEILLEDVESIFYRQNGIPAVWKKTIPMTFHTAAGLVYYYFLSTEGEPIMPPRVNSSFIPFIGSLLIYMMIILIVLLVITILSPDHHYSRYWVHLSKTLPSSFSLNIIPLIFILILSGDIITGLTGWLRYFSAIGYILSILILILSAKYGKMDYLDFGLRRDRIRNGYLLAFIAAILMIGVTRGLPVGVYNEGLSAVLRLPLIIILIALPQEMIWRGYIQAILSRLLDPTKGLLAMSFLAAFLHFLYLIATAPWLIAYPYTYLEVAVLVPGTAAILGYIYLRTENILSCVLAHSLILWLSGTIFY